MKNDTADEMTDAEVREDEIRREKHIIKIELFVEFIKIFVGCEVLLSVIASVLMKFGFVPSGDVGRFCLILLLLCVYLFLCFDKCARIHLIFKNPRLFFKPVLSAYAVVVILSILISAINTDMALWTFMIMRLFRLLGTTNIVSFLITDIILLAVIAIAYSFADKREM